MPTSRKNPDVRPLVWFSGLAVLIALWLGASHLWGDSIAAWLSHHPRLTRVVGATQTLISLAATWAALREPKTGALLPWCLGLLAAWNLLELPLDALAGSVLLLLGVVALAARPWPNRAIMAHCIAIAGLTVLISSTLRS